MAVLGPTASGKSAVAERLAGEHEAELLSVDSMQVYRGMDIGTAKPDVATRHRLTYRMIDLADPADEYSVAEFQEVGRGHLDRLQDANATAIVVGGSGLHFRALVDPLEFPPTDPALRATLEASSIDDLAVELLAADPEATEHVDLANPRRVVRAVEILRLTGDTPTARAQRPAAVAVRSYATTRRLVAIGFDPGPALGGRIERRFDRMVEDGFVDEVEALSGRLGVTASQAVGYRELLEVVRGNASLASAREAAIASTRSLARRQRTFFKRDPRIRWLVWDHDPDRRAAAAQTAIEEASAWSS